MKRIFWSFPSGVSREFEEDFIWLTGFLCRVNGKLSKVFAASYRGAKEVKSVHTCTVLVLRQFFLKTINSRSRMFGYSYFVYTFGELGRYFRSVILSGTFTFFPRLLLTLVLREGVTNNCVMVLFFYLHFWTGNLVTAWCFDRWITTQLEFYTFSGVWKASFLIDCSPDE